jgi:ATP/ADP translocase
MTPQAPALQGSVLVDFVGPKEERNFHGRGFPSIRAVHGILLDILATVFANRARRRLGWIVAAALGLIVLSWTIFIQGLGLTIPVWPDF